ncbi:hypothetical protein M2163_006160 [Streptomyces sp. SAI-135]|uniref:hypothetical protein n=1 Tax=unclassified Streptomyces TaxID=2593676 RepID=UPI0024746CBB|nr:MULTISPECIES: hypothetical protein [unclassified Streptomyces]MDH6516860.1 hypothetical protein [Streptomyces sp. SAI-090]MDH6619052.1 hypothetical protein [Streptomyces sp. SAI-135]
MKRSSRARTGAAATVSVLSLALVTGCGGGSGADSGKAAASPSTGTGTSAATAPAAKARSAAELEKLLLAKGDVAGYDVDPGDDTLPKGKSAVKADRSACAPLAYAISGLPPADTEASANNTVTSQTSTPSPGALDEASVEGAFDIDMTIVGLSSYEGDGAEKAVEAVSDGIAACSGGFGIAAEGENLKITKVAAGKASGKGDQSVAFAVSSDMDGEGTAGFTVDVVRVGSTVSTYYTVDFASLGSGKAATVPAAVLDAQVAKLT